MYRVSIFRFLY